MPKKKKGEITRFHYAASGKTPETVLRNLGAERPKGAGGVQARVLDRTEKFVGDLLRLVAGEDLEYEVAIDADVARPDDIWLEVSIEVS